jgi:hypothetical protein
MRVKEGINDLTSSRTIRRHKRAIEPMLRLQTPFWGDIILKAVSI